MFVREPMERLVSLYFDKFVNSKQETMAKYSKKVKEMALQLNNITKSNSSAPPTFEDFLKIVVLKQNESQWIFQPGFLNHIAPFYKVIYT